MLHSLIHTIFLITQLLCAARTVRANTNTQDYCCRAPGGSLSNKPSRLDVLLTALLGATRDFSGSQEVMCEPEGEEAYSVAEIWGHSWRDIGVKPTIHYKTRWLGYDKTASTYEPLANLLAEGSDIVAGMVATYNEENAGRRNLYACDKCNFTQVFQKKRGLQVHVARSHKVDTDITTTGAGSMEQREPVAPPLNCDGAESRSNRRVYPHSAEERIHDYQDITMGQHGPCFLITQ